MSTVPLAATPSRTTKDAPSSWNRSIRSTKSIRRITCAATSSSDTTFDSPPTTAEAMRKEAITAPMAAKNRRLKISRIVESAGGPAPVDDEGLPGEEGARRRGEQKERPVELVRLTHPRDR